MSYLIEDETRLYTAPGGYAYRLQFYQDSDASPPWEDNDGALPLIWISDSRNGFRKEGDRGYNLTFPFKHLSDRAIRANLDEIATLIGYSGKAAFDQDARLYFPDTPIGDARRELLAERREDIPASQSGLETLARFWTLAGVPAYVSVSRGYSQGDWAAILTVAHPDAVKAFGFAAMQDYRKACPDDHKAAVNAWGAWCWGGVIGYRVDRIDPAELAELREENDGADPSAGDLNRLRKCTHVDSCWGFYPEHDQDYFPLDRNHAYAIGQAKEAADSDAEDLAERDAPIREAEAETVALALMESRPDMYQGAGA